MAQLLGCSRIPGDSQPLPTTSAPGLQGLSKGQGDLAQRLSVL
jgi:hypothetical protein